MSKARGYEYRTTTVCLDSYENGIFSGRFYNPYLETGVEFKSLAQFLLKMEQVLDNMEFPQSYTMTRTFTAIPRQNTGPPEITQFSGTIATFSIRVLFRQNSSWQGSIVWLEEEQEQSFRSALELIFLMDNALSSVSEHAS